MGVLAMADSFRLVVVNSFNIYRSRRILGLLEAYVPLAVNPDGILALAIASQGLQPSGVESRQVPIEVAASKLLSRFSAWRRNGSHLRTFSPAASFSVSLSP